MRYTNTETETLQEIYFSLFPEPAFVWRPIEDAVGAALNGQPVTPQLEQDQVQMKIDLPRAVAAG